MTRPPPLLLDRLVAIHLGLAAAGFPHAVGGAIALAVHVREPRFTADIDLNVIADPAHPEPLFAALPSAITVADSSARLVRATGQVRLWWPDPATPVDLFLPQHPTFHHQVQARSQPYDFLGHEIPVISATDLMVFKMLFDRTKDWPDIESMLAAGSGDPDEAARWVAQLLGANAPQLQRLADSRGRGGGAG